jgi:glycosyltransferase involved in cell wall biosynthesis
MCLISIIIPTYNRASLISDTLDSVINLNYKNWECLIIDDGSIDNTQNIIEIYIEKDSRFKYYKRPLNIKKGPNSCRNFGFEKSIGAWVKWFDSDDLFLPNAFDFFLNKCVKNIDIVVCKLQRVNFSTHEIINDNKIFSTNLIQDYLIGEVAFYVCGPTWCRSFLEKQKELFDESISNLDDWDFNLRMLYQGLNITYIDEVLIKYRVHTSSLSQEITKLNVDEIKSEFRAREKHLKLIKGIENVNSLIFQIYIKDRYKYILRDALIQRNNYRWYFLKLLLVSQVKVYDFVGVLKTLLSFTTFILFNKGYKLLN